MTESPGNQPMFAVSGVEPMSCIIEWPYPFPTTPSPFEFPTTEPQVHPFRYTSYTTSTIQIAEPEARPWECPRCQVVNAPHVNRCECKPVAK